MRLDLDTLDIICTLVDDVPTLLSCSLTCHALRGISAKKLFAAVGDVALRDERSIRAFHAFLLADSTARSPYLRNLQLLIQEAEQQSRPDIAQLVVDILKHATHLRSLEIPYGARTFLCLPNPAIPKTIWDMTRLGHLSIPVWSVFTEKILLRTQSPLKLLRVALQPAGMATPDAPH